MGEKEERKGRERGKEGRKRRGWERKRERKGKGRERKRTQVTDKMVFIEKFTFFQRIFWLFNARLKY